jgi:predicted Fe-S protein YdhL (DUF1289 family)
MIKKILIALVVLFVLIQFVRIDKTNPVSAKENDFIEIYQPPAEIAELLKTSCYDCHSNESKYPWYTNVAPFSLFVEHHIDEAREYFNFSDWSSLTDKKKDHILEECAEEVEEGEMPLSSYLIMHSEAELSHEQKEVLEHYFSELRK